MDREKRIDYTKKVVFTGLIIAMALVVRNFSQMLYIGGVPAMRVGFSGIFSKLPALLFGPLFGGISGGVVDVLGFMMQPMGAYLPWYTMTAVLSGVVAAMLWKALKNIDPAKLQKSFITFFVVIGVIGVANHISFIFFTDSFLAKAVGSMGKNKAFAYYGLEIIGMAGMVLFVVDILVKRLLNKTFIHDNFLKLLIVLGAAGLLETTINTYIIMATAVKPMKTAFIFFLIPRLIEQVVQTVIQAYTIPFILYAYSKFAGKAISNEDKLVTEK